MRRASQGQPITQLQTQVWRISLPQSCQDFANFNSRKASEIAMRREKKSRLMPSFDF